MTDAAIVKAALLTYRAQAAAARDRFMRNATSAEAELVILADRRQEAEDAIRAAKDDRLQRYALHLLARLDQTGLGCGVDSKMLLASIETIGNDAERI